MAEDPWLLAFRGDLDGLRTAITPDNLDARDGDGWTPLLAACENAQPETLAWLIEQGASLDAVLPKNGASAAHICVQAASWRGDRRAPDGGFGDEKERRAERCLGLLVRAGAPLELHQTSGGATPLHDAAAFGIGPLLAVLLENPIAVDPRDKQGQTPLMTAACRGRAMGCYALIEAGADVNASLGPNFTILHACAEKGEVGTARMLVDRGADPVARLTADFEKHKAGATPGDVARAWNQRAFAEWADQFAGR